jgi:CRISPR-associated protein Csx1
VSAITNPALSLFVTTWGLPAVWQEAPYVFNPGEKSERKYCTALIPLLMREVVDEGKLDLVIVVLDSLVDKYTPRDQARPQESKCYECYNDLSKYIDMAASSSTYTELISHIKQFIEEFVKCLLDKYNVELEVKPRVVVAPAVGSPGGKWVFKGELWDYQSKVLIELGELCLNKPYQRVVLDLSHGINYMPSLTLHLSPMLSSILLLAHRELKSVEFILYNSDPFSSNRPLVLNKDEVKVDSIHLIHRRIKLTELSGWARFEAAKYLELKRALDNIFHEILDYVKYLYTSLYYPLPLALYYLTREDTCRRLNEAWDKIKRGLEDSVFVNREKCEVLRPITVDPLTLYMYYVARALCKRLGDHGLEDPLITRLREREVEVYELVHKALHRVAQHELDDIVNKMRELRSQEILYKYLKDSWIRLCQLRAIAGVEKDGCTEKIDLYRFENRRNLVAHAGLLKDLVEVYVEDDAKIKIRYVEREEVLKNMLEALYSELIPVKS